MTSFSVGEFSRNLWPTKHPFLGQARLLGEPHGVDGLGTSAVRVPGAVPSGVWLPYVEAVGVPKSSPKWWVYHG